MVQPKYKPIVILISSKIFSDKFFFFIEHRKKIFKPNFLFRPNKDLRPKIPLQHSQSQHRLNNFWGSPFYKPDHDSYNGVNKKKDSCLQVKIIFFSNCENPKIGVLCSLITAYNFRPPNTLGSTFDEWVHNAAITATL